MESPDTVIKTSSMDSEKIKLMFSLIGDLVVMLLSLINIFKKNEK